MTEAEEAQELKRALSSQMIQLLFEQEQRLEGYLREFITFDGRGSSSLLNEQEGEEEEEGGERKQEMVERWGNEGTAAAAATAEDGGAVVGAASFPASQPRGSGVADDDDDDGFEKVDAWMAQGFSEDSGHDSASRREREGSLLVPFPSS